jgi:hypothetical protein
MSFELAREHGEDKLPVAIGGALVVYVAVGQRVAVLRARMDLVAVLHRRLLQRFRDRGDGRHGREGILFRKSAVKLPARPHGIEMRGIVPLGDEARAVQARARTETFGEGAGDAKDEPAAEAVADRAYCTGLHRLAVIEKAEQVTGVIHRHPV